VWMEFDPVVTTPPTPPPAAAPAAGGRPLAGRVAGIARGRRNGGRQSSGK
jgi:hypothetical protein